MKPVSFAGTTLYFPQNHEQGEALLEALQQMGKTGIPTTLRILGFERDEETRDAVVFSHPASMNAKAISVGNSQGLVPIQDENTEFHAGPDRDRVVEFVRAFAPSLTDWMLFRIFPVRMNPGTTEK